MQCGTLLVVFIKC